MKKQVYEINENGYIKEIYVAEFDKEGNMLEELLDNIVIKDPPQGLYRARWTGVEWVEDMTQTDINTLNNQIKDPSIEDRLALAEDTINFLLGL